MYRLATRRARFLPVRRRHRCANYGECRPPADDAGFLAFARRVAPPDVMAAIDRSEPAGEIVTHGFPANRRRRYDRLPRFPAGLLVTGDALCSFNPIYGQGMTVAALEALALRRCLAAGGHDLAGRFFGAIAPAVDAAWQLALGSDLAVAEVPGPRPARVWLTNAYVGRLQAVAARDERLAAAFMLVAGLVELPQRLLRPGVVARVAAGSLRRPARGARVRRPAGGAETAGLAPCRRPASPPTTRSTASGCSRSPAEDAIAAVGADPRDEKLARALQQVHPHRPASGRAARARALGRS